MNLTGVLNNLLTGTTGGLSAGTFNLAQDTGLDPVEWPMARRVEHLDLPGICKFCIDRHGRRILVSDPDFLKYRGQYHINCRGYWAYLHKDNVDHEGNPIQPNWMTPPPKMSQEEYDIRFNDMKKAHAHFVVEPEKYSALHVPAGPSGRPMIYLPGRDGAPGQMIFAPMLPPALLLRTVAGISARALAAAPEWASAYAETLRQCGEQIAQRAPADTALYVRGFDKDHYEYGRDLSPEQFAALPAHVLADDQGAVATATLRLGTRDVPAVLYRSGADVVALATDDGRLCHLGVPPTLVKDLPDFKVLKGVWR
jgi:hypothetical protein